MFDFSSILQAKDLIGGFGGGSGPKPDMTGASAADLSAIQEMRRTDPTPVAPEMSNFERAARIVDRVGQAQQQQPQNNNPKTTQEAIGGITNSPFAQGLKKVAGAVVSFYTGGLGGLAMNVGSQAMGQK